MPLGGTLWMLVIGVFDLVYAATLSVFVARDFVSTWLAWLVPLLIAVGFFTLYELAKHVRVRWAANDERAAGTTPTTLARPHVPLSFPAKARAPLHRSADLLARDDR